MLQHAPLVASMYQTLREKRDGAMSADFFLDLFGEHFPGEEAERQLTTAVDWGRYAELLYDASARRVYLPEAVAGVGDAST